MAAGPLHPDNLTNGRDRDVTRGHGTRPLGPSDTSDSGSDIAGTDPAALLAEDVPDGADIDTDHIESIPPEAEDEDAGDEDEPPKH